MKTMQVVTSGGDLVTYPLPLNPERVAGSLMRDYPGATLGTEPEQEWEKDNGKVD